MINYLLSTEFLKSPPGILLLGALGSILGYLLIKLFKMIIRSIFSEKRKEKTDLLILKSFSFFILPMIASNLMANKYEKNKDYLRFLILILTKFTGLILSTIAVFFNIFALYVLIVFKGFVFSYLLIVLISILFLMIFSWIRDAIGVYALQDLYILKDINSIKEYIRSSEPDKVIELIDSVLDTDGENNEDNETKKLEG